MDFEERRNNLVATYFLFAVYVFVTLFPFYWIFISSVTPKHKLFSIPPLYFPMYFTTENFTRMMRNIPFSAYLRNSLIFALCSSALSVFLSFFAAYAFARIRFRGSNLLLLFFLLSIALPPITTVIPLYELYGKVNLLNTIEGMVIAMSSLITPFTIWVLITFIKQVPVEIEEAAAIDGAGFLRILFRISLPLILPAIGTMFVINFITSWNELLYPLVFGVDASSKTLTVGLTEVALESTAYGKPWDLMSALSIVMIVPVVVLVIVFQRTIVEGLTRGAIK
ncbi:carbohydrate ABC transporter permease [Candidatus Caldatribacterium sp.]|uniref:carbohydrate ABC transporter permease n=1 Tax=Candidatus Caldatribacterium sp. TaxID=2282143 RepID=UPI0029980873|nr:carbohydrate ABC transporter permease [Candidatus Caldatribacterium sp.]MDW8081348.1 carbohydrate ABC transporter permease [Candidatus Calescibacterium sp.]